MTVPAELADRVAPVALAGERVLPVDEALAGLLPDGGLRRGSVTAVEGSTALALAVLAAPSRTGSWCAVVGVPWLGLAAAADAGVELARLALVPEPGERWLEVVAALIDGLDVVVLCPPARAGQRGTRRLAARARERGTALVVIDPPLGPGRLRVDAQWPGAELRLAAEPRRWEGIADGHGRLLARLVDVRATGRGAAARPRTARLWLPDPDGQARVATADELVETMPPVSGHAVPARVGEQAG